MTDFLPLPPEYRPLDGTDRAISSLAWGMWRFHGEDVRHAASLVHAALDAGITLFDTADIYGPDNGEPFGASEALLGKVFGVEPDLRNRMVLASKGGIVIGTPYDSSRTYLEAAIDASLRRLNVERVDLWQVHRPDLLTHPEELARALEDAVTAGKIGAVGVSNFTKDQIETLRHFLTIRLVSTQPEFSVAHLDPLVDGQFDQAMRFEMLTLAWSPLGGGRVANPESPRDKAIADALDPIARQFGVSRGIAALSWIAAHPSHPIPIAGTQTPDRIAELKDFRTVRWTRASWYKVLTAGRGEPLP